MGEFDGALVIWELTRACDRACRPCRPEPRRERDDRELTTAGAYAMLARIAASSGNPRVLLTGGDPLKRPDLFNIIRRSVSLGLDTTVRARATPLLTHAAVARFKDSGAARMTVSLDGPNKAAHDGFGGVDGSYARTIAALRSAVRVGLETQIDTPVTHQNAEGLAALGAIVAREGARRWNLLFPECGLTAQEQECALAFLRRAGFSAPFDIIRRSAGSSAGGNGQPLAFVLHTGEVRPFRYSPHPPPILEAAC